MQKMTEEEKKERIWKLRRLNEEKDQLERDISDLKPKEERLAEINRELEKIYFG